MLLNELRKTRLSQSEAEDNADIVGVFSSECCLDNSPQSDFLLSFKLPSILHRIFVKKTPHLCLPTRWIKLKFAVKIRSPCHETQRHMKKIMCKNPLAVKHGFLLDVIFQLSLNFPLHFLNGKTKKKTRNTI